MKRKLTIAGIFLGLAVAVVFVVIATQQPAEEEPRSGFTLTTNNELIVESRSRPTIIAHFPKTNSSAASKTAD